MYAKFGEFYKNNEGKRRNAKARTLMRTVEELEQTMPAQRVRTDEDPSEEAGTAAEMLVLPRSIRSESGSMRPTRKAPNYDDDYDVEPVVEEVDVDDVERQVDRMYLFDPTQTQLNEKDYLEQQEIYESLLDKYTLLVSEAMVFEVRQSTPGGRRARLSMILSSAEEELFTAIVRLRRIPHFRDDAVERSGIEVKNLEALTKTLMEAYTVGDLDARTLSSDSSRLDSAQHFDMGSEASFADTAHSFSESWDVLSNHGSSLLLAGSEISRVSDDVWNVVSARGQLEARTSYPDGMYRPVT